ncbi:hypothetical protein HMPREF1318_0043 [Actinomyces massiliensis F0489]|uniref:Uncharacterized protein n=1 Tax=Actinomyces massiliensis F0489 TaxID=1125718 RepID=J0WSW9_9ACTO|nr:hypothetical protein HMPREF1318_0043 [Actinomyces massiliensis F0489]
MSGTSKIEECCAHGPSLLPQPHGEEGARGPGPERSGQAGRRQDPVAGLSTRFSTRFNARY